MGAGSLVKSAPGSWLMRGQVEANAVTTYQKTSYVRSFMIVIFKIKLLLGKRKLKLGQGGANSASLFQFHLKLSLPLLTEINF